MGSIRQDHLARLWHGQDPFSHFPKNLFEVDTQGWGSTHHYLLESFIDRKPAVVIEIGVWKGASSIVLASELRRLNIDGVVLCVDTWLGSTEHWLNPAWFDWLSFDHGYPSLHRKFMSNVISQDLQDYVIPVPLDSLNAAALMKARGVLADLIHIDGGHDYQSVISDLREWWPVLKPGGMLIGDDYYDETHWPGVKQAFDEFFQPLGVLPLENVSGKCRLIKPI